MCHHMPNREFYYKENHSLVIQLRVVLIESQINYLIISKVKTQHRYVSTPHNIHIHKWYIWAQGNTIIKQNMICYCKLYTSESECYSTEKFQT